jgi:hypothetical protein
MEELRGAVGMLAEEAQQVATEMQGLGDVPSPLSLRRCKRLSPASSAASIAYRRAMDSGAEAREEV